MKFLYALTRKFIEWEFFNIAVSYKPIDQISICYFSMLAAIVLNKLVNLKNKILIIPKLF